MRGDPEDRGRLHVVVLTLDQDERLQFVRREAALGQQSLPDFGLEGREAERPLRVPRTTN
jgi:hypothetical protein